MPAFIGVSNINQVASSANVLFGDAPFISPRTATKTFSGGGSGNIAFIENVLQIFSFNNSIDPDVNDENVIAPGPGAFTPLIPIAPLPIPTGKVSPVAMRGKRR